MSLPTTIGQPAFPVYVGSVQGHSKNLGLNDFQNCKDLAKPVEG